MSESAHPADKLEHLAAFQQPVISWCETLSQCLTLVAEGHHPELQALAFWLRPQHLQAIKARYPEGLSGCGTVFHIPPSNVPTLMVYTLVTSLLAGNRNIVRISSERRNEITRLCLQALRDSLAQPDHAALARAIELVEYGYDDAQTRILASRSEVVLLWGGPDSLAHLQAVVDGIPASNRPRTLTFPQRHSAAYIDLDDSSPEDDYALLQRLERDLFPFLQQACSSAKALFFKGKGEGANERIRQILKQLDERLIARDLPFGILARASAEQAVYLQNACRESDTPVLSHNKTGWLWVHVSHLTEALLQSHPGYFTGLVCRVEDASAVARNCPLSLQTITCWPKAGGEDKALEAALPKHLRRVVVGQALDFDVVWDGKDLIRELSQ